MASQSSGEKTLGEIAPATRARNFTRERTRLRVFHLLGDRCPLPATVAAGNRVFALKL